MDFKSATVLLSPYSPSYANCLHFHFILFFPCDVCFSCIAIIPILVLYNEFLDIFFWSNRFPKKLPSLSNLFTVFFTVLFLTVLFTVFFNTPHLAFFSYSSLNSVHHADVVLDKNYRGRNLASIICL